MMLVQTPFVCDAIQRVVPSIMNSRTSPKDIRSPYSAPLILLLLLLRTLISIVRSRRPVEIGPADITV